MRMELLILLLLLQVLKAAFGAIEEPEGAPVYDYFLFSDQLLTRQTWFYFLVERVIDIATAFIMWIEIPFFKNTFKTIFLIEVFCLGQYLLHYNSEYFDPISEWCGYKIRFSTHIITTLILARVILNEK